MYTAAYVCRMKTKGVGYRRIGAAHLATPAADSSSRMQKRGRVGGFVFGIAGGPVILLARSACTR